ncbi:MAG: hypothetical protein ABIP51_07965 [Bacteroidia bacterium]
MIKSVFTTACICLTLTSAIAQKKYEKIMYKDVSVEGDGMTILAKDAVSNKAGTKFKLKIINKTDDAILYKPEESTLKINSKEVKPKEKWMQVAPVESESKVINFEATDYIVPGYSYEVNGLYKVSVLDKPVAAEDFQLPPAQNEFKAGNFTCAMSDLKKETDKTNVKFECRYTGDKIGVINSKKATIKLPDGTEIANSKGNRPAVLLMKGGSERISLSWNRMDGGKETDMQKIKLMIVWHSTFVEADPVKVKPVTLDFAIDEATSK